MISMVRDKLLALHRNSYSPYSHFPVSAILITKDGREYYGVNVEDASYRAGACAERVAIFSALADGARKGDFKEINIMVSGGNVGEPCFVCRQMFAELFDEDVVIRCWATTGEYRIFKMSELCPHPFNSEDLA